MTGLRPATRPIVEAALATLRDSAPKSASEIPYDSKPPRSASFMWKLVRFRLDSGYVLGIGTFTRHATVFFYRGRELDDGNWPPGMLQGRGKDTRFVTLRSPADARSPEFKRLVRKAFRLGGSKAAAGGRSTR